MTLLELDAKYSAALPHGAAFAGHPTQLEAAVALFNEWPALKSAIAEQANTIRLQEAQIQRLIADLPKHAAERTLG